MTDRVHGVIGAAMLLVSAVLLALLLQVVDGCVAHPGGLW